MEVLVRIGVRLLEAIFVVGGIGSVIVLLLTSIEDIGTLVSSDEREQRG